MRSASPHRRRHHSRLSTPVPPFRTIHSTGTRTHDRRSTTRKPGGGGATRREWQ
jgi:hypothetical protein